MIATRKNLALDKGANFEQKFRYLEGNTPIDLSDYGASFRIYKLGDESVLEAIAEAACDADGWIIVEFGNAATGALSIGKHAYVLEIVKTGEVTRLLFGTLEVRGVANG